LRLYPTVVETSAPDSLQVYSLSSANSGWVEGTGTTAAAGDPPDTGQSTWDGRVQGSVGWAGSAGASSFGVDFTTLLGATPFNAASGVGGSNPFDVVFNPALVQPLISDWVSGNNPGLFLRVAVEADRSIRFSSAEDLNAGLHPELIITYAVPEPAAGLMLLAIVLPLGLRRRK
jgi:hypothetical protein